MGGQEVTGASERAARALGAEVLSRVLETAADGVAICDAQRRYLYVNPAGCRVLGRRFEDLVGRDLLDNRPAREHDMVRRQLAELLEGPNGFLTATVVRPDGEEREVTYSIAAIPMGDRRGGAAVFRDTTDASAAARAAAALGQTATATARAGDIDEILAAIAGHAVSATGGVACGISVVDEAGMLRPAATVGVPEALQRAVAAHDALPLQDLPQYASVLQKGRMAVIADITALGAQMAANPETAGRAALLPELGWEAAVFIPLRWREDVIGLVEVYFPTGAALPGEAELVFLATLADQAAVAIVNARLAEQSRRSAALLERQRLARELHDSVSQALFSMTLHARAAQLAMVRDGLPDDGALGRAVIQLRELTQGALAEMRALIFELRPGALAEEGLVAALRKQAAALTAREGLPITVSGPDERLALPGEVEEHLYRIALEALHNVVKHAAAHAATAIVDTSYGAVGLTIVDDGRGFDPTTAPPGHLGLRTMAERARAIGARLQVDSRPGAGTTVALHLPLTSHEDRP